MSPIMLTSITEIERLRENQYNLAKGLKERGMKTKLISINTGLTIEEINDIKVKKIIIKEKNILKQKVMSM